MDPSVFDRDHLARYTGGDAAVEAELFDLLDGSIRRCLGVLEASRDDPQAWRDAAHTLKGAARGVGCMELGDACEAAEARAGDPDALKALEEAAARARAAIAEARR